MAVKMSGAEFSAFYSDPAFWPLGTWHDDTVITIDGEQAEDYEAGDVPESAVVCIECGVVFSGDDTELGSIVSYFKKWKKSQKFDRLVIEVPKEKVMAFNDSLKAFGAKVIA